MAPPTSSGGQRWHRIQRGAQPDPASNLTAEVADTSRGPVEFARVGDPPYILFLHGSPGGYDQGVGNDDFSGVGIRHHQRVATRLPAHASVDGSEHGGAGGCDGGVARRPRRRSGGATRRLRAAVRPRSSSRRVTRTGRPPCCSAVRSPSIYVVDSIARMADAPARVGGVPPRTDLGHGTFPQGLNRGHAPRREHVRQACTQAHRNRDRQLSRTTRPHARKSPRVGPG